MSHAEAVGIGIAFGIGALLSTVLALVGWFVSTHFDERTGERVRRSTVERRPVPAEVAARDRSHARTRTITVRLAG